MWARKAVRRSERLSLAAVGPSGGGARPSATLGLMTDSTSPAGFDETKHPRGQPDNAGQFQAQAGSDAASSRRKNCPQS